MHNRTVAVAPQLHTTRLKEIFAPHRSKSFKIKPPNLPPNNTELVAICTCSVTELLCTFFTSVKWYTLHKAKLVYWNFRCNIFNIFKSMNGNPGSALSLTPYVFNRISWLHSWFTVKKVLILTCIIHVNMYTDNFEIYCIKNPSQKWIVSFESS